MALLESLTWKLAPALAKAVLKLWLPEKLPMLGVVGDGIIEIMKKRGEDFATIDATDRLFRNLAPEVAGRLQQTIEIEFPQLPESDRDAAVLAVAEVFQRLELSRDMMRADLNAVGLEQIAKPQAQALFASLGGEAQALAELTLRESCAYAVMLAGKLPDFQVAATRELLKRTNELVADLARVLDIVGSMREHTGGNDAAANFETQYRRVLSQRLNRMQLFGVSLVGAGARDPEISVAYVTLTSTRGEGAQSRDVDQALAGLTRAVVRGEAGSGKTILLQWLAIRAASRDFAGALELWNQRMPFYVCLRDHIDGQFPPPEKLVASMAPNVAALMPADWTHEALTRGALVLIDGVDEVPVAKRGELFDWLRDFVENFPQSLFVLSSRPAALDAQVARGRGGTAAHRLAELDFKPITLEPMSLPDSEALISKWHQAVGRDLVDDEAQAKLERYERELIRVLHDRPAIRSLASNPLLCSMICVLNWDRGQRLPNDRMQLYALALEMLIDARDADRRIRAARLGELDRQSKEALLDGIAYWMMRNGKTEADRSDVEEQVATLLQRLSKVPQVADEVLQELLERSGVLRQPQAGIVDFVHRTFLEYMAARAAVRAGDLGLLTDKAREDNWRETIVFAAGHAQGKQRDQLIGMLLKTPFFSLGARPLEVAVTAACCLETAGANLDPELLKRLRDCATCLFPPRSVEIARVLAPAAQLDPGLLKGHGGADETAVAACIRCASIVGGDSMLEIIETYADHPGERVWEELIAAWTAFDEDAYLQRVIQKRSVQKIGGLKLPNLDVDSLHCLQLLVLKGTHHKSTKDLSEALANFIEYRSLRVGSQVYGNEDVNIPGGPSALRGAVGAIFGSPAAKGGPKPTMRVTESDARRIAKIGSLRHLYLGTSERGVLEAIVGLPELVSLACSPVDPSEVAVLAQCPVLAELEISGQSVPSRVQPTTEFDLRSLAQCPVLKKLAVEFVTGPSVRLPVGARLDELSLAYVPLSTLEQLRLFPTLLKLRLHFKSLPEGEFDLTPIAGLTDVSLYVETAVRFRLPPSLRKLRLVKATVAAVANASELVALEELSLRNVGQLESAHTLLEHAQLQRLWIDSETRNRIGPSLIARAGARGVKIDVSD